MGKILQLKWYGWVLLSFQLLLNLSIVIANSNNVIENTLYASPFVPEYAVYISYLYKFLILAPAIICVLGLGLLFYKHRLGWVLTTPMILWNVFLYFEYDGYLSDLSLTILTLQFLCVLSIVILFLPSTRNQFKLKPLNFITSFVVLLVFFLVKYNVVFFSYILSRLIN